MRATDSTSAEAIDSTDRSSRSSRLIWIRWRFANLLRSRAPPLPTLSRAGATAGSRHSGASLWGMGPLRWDSEGNGTPGDHDRLAPGRTISIPFPFDGMNRGHSAVFRGFAPSIATRRETLENLDSSAGGPNGTRWPLERASAGNDSRGLTSAFRETSGTSSAWSCSIQGAGLVRLKLYRELA